jgi:catechol 2,3-dioxygenase-like lactoylglutathione lyase family enzyme
MRVTEIAFSCYPVTDVARARAFYEGVLGLTPAMNHETPNGHWIEYEIGSGTLSIGSAPGWKPSSDG